jgi:hypothetical protein
MGDGNIEIDDNELAIEEEDLQYHPLSPLSIFQIEIIRYVSGFIVRKIISRIGCTACRSILSDQLNEENCRLLSIKNRGFLTVPSEEICDVGLVCEQLFRERGIRTRKEDVVGKIMQMKDKMKILDHEHKHIPQLISMFVEMFCMFAFTMNVKKIQKRR